MESVLAVISCLGVGLTLSLLTLKPRRSQPVWPPLLAHMAAPPDVTLTSGSSSGVLHQIKNENTNSEASSAEAVEAPMLGSEKKDSVSSTAAGGDGTRKHDANIASTEDKFLLECEEDDSVKLLDNKTMAFQRVNHANAVDKSLNSISEAPSLKVVVPSSKRNLIVPVTRQRRVLFVIAHPDDECMFFGPAILHFTQKEKAMVFLICLTNGSYDGANIGKRRQRELWDSCQLLGIPAGHITLYRCRHLPDHPSKTWPLVNTANIINKHLHTLGCDMVVTFDGGGVSGHINHRSLHSSLRYLVEERLLPEECHAYALDSVNVMRKYSSVLDLPCSLLCSSHVITADTRQYCIIRAAMRAHASQYVWFRRLYMLFSRYVVINTLTLLLPPGNKPLTVWLKMR